MSRKNAYGNDSVRGLRVTGYGLPAVSRSLFESAKRVRLERVGCANRWLTEALRQPGHVLLPWDCAAIPDAACPHIAAPPTA